MLLAVNYPQQATTTLHWMLQLHTLSPGPFEATYQSAIIRTWLGVDQKHKQGDQGSIPVDCRLFTSSQLHQMCLFSVRFTGGGNTGATQLHANAAGSKALAAYKI